MSKMLLLLMQMVFFGKTHVFLHLSSIGQFDQKEPFPTLKTMICKKNSIQKLTQFSQGNNVLDGAASNTDGFWGETHVFLQLSWIGLYGTKWAFLHLENSICWKYFFQKNWLNSQRTTMCKMLQFLIYLVFFGDIHVFLQLSWIGLLEQTEPISTLKI
jgi:hypothetical protein